MQVAMLRPLSIKEYVARIDLSGVDLPLAPQTD